MVSFVSSLLDGLLRAITEAGVRRVALIGATPAALEIHARLSVAASSKLLVGVFDPSDAGLHLPDGRPWNSLSDAAPDLLVICSDAAKEDLLRAAAAQLDDIDPPPRAVLAGTAHLDYRDADFLELDEPSLVPSYATGYSHTRVHLFQCLKAAAANGLTGAVVEFGAFKGGTTVWLAKAVRGLGLDSRVIGFDSWSGFPPRRSIFDLYEHPRCIFTELDAVRAYADPHSVELVPGEISETCRQLVGTPILVAFMDTDNYSAARAALEVCLSELVVGGAIVFDHYWTTEDYVYTIGERLAAQDVLAEAGLLQLHGTGVFVRVG